jgi:hypothetical protein
MGPTRKLFHTDCFSRTGVNTDAAIDAVIEVNLGLVVSHLDSFTRTLWYTGLTTSAFFAIYFNRHLHNPFKKQLKTCP